MSIWSAKQKLILTWVIRSFLGLAIAVAVGAMGASTRAAHLATPEKQATACHSSGARAAALAKLGAAYARAGDTQSARETITLALDAVSGVEQSGRHTAALTAIAWAQAAAGDAAGALDTAARIKDAGTPHTLALTGISLAQAKTGDVAGAMETLTRTSDGVLRTLGWAAAAVALSESGSLVHARRAAAIALDAAKALEEAQIRGWALGAVAVAQAVARDKAGARQTISQILDLANTVGQPDFDFEPFFLVLAAMAQAMAGEHAASLEIANSISDRKDRAMAIALTAIVQAQAGNLAQARRVAELALDDEKISGTDADPIFYLTLAWVHFNASNTAQALDVLRAIADNEARVAAFAVLAVARAASGDISGARRILDEVKPFMADASGMAQSTLALAQVKSGRPESALVTLKWIRDETYHEEARLFVSLGRFLGGDLTGAIENGLEFMRNRHFSGSRPKFAELVATVQAESADFGAALATAQGITDFADGTRPPHHRVKVLKKLGTIQHHVVIALAQEGDISDALAMTRRIRSDELRGHTLAELALVQSSAGDKEAAGKTLRLARDVVLAIPRPGNRAKLLGEVAAKQAEAGDLAGASANVALIMRIARAIEPNVISQWDLHDISGALGKTAVSQVEAGDAAGARQTLAFAREVAERVGMPGTRAIALSELATQQARTGDTKGAWNIGLMAREVARAIRDPIDRVAVLSKWVAARQTEAGDLEGARQTALIAVDIARNLGGWWIEPQALTTAAVAQTRAGDLIGARKTIELAIQSSNIIDTDGTFLPNWLRPKIAEALRLLALAQFEAGNVPGSKAASSLARDITQKFDGLFSRVVGLAEVAATQVEVDDTSGARETTERARYLVRTIADPCSRIRAVSKVMPAQAKAGNTAEARTGGLEARKIALTFVDPFSRALALIEVAAQQVGIGDLEGSRQTTRMALKVANHLLEDGPKAQALIRAAHIQVKSGDTMGARQTLVTAEKTAGMIKVDHYRIWTLAEAAEAQLEAGDVIAAARTANLAAQATELNSQSD